MKIDFDLKSNFSIGRDTIPAIVDRYGQGGYRAIAFTDALFDAGTVRGFFAQHGGRSLTRASFPFYLALLKTEAARAWSRYGMLVLPGLHVVKPTLFAGSTEIIAIGIDQFVNPSHDLQRIASELQRQDVAAVQFLNRGRSPSAWLQPSERDIRWDVGAILMHASRHGDSRGLTLAV